MKMKERIAAICRSSGISDLYVFGSRADEIAGLFRDGVGQLSEAGSDVDIGVLPEKREPWSPERRVNVSMALEDLFEADRVDLVILPEADPYLALDVIRGELLYTNDPDRQARYELFVLRRAADLLPFKKQRTRMILEEGAR
jgi:predicted nucleotidyltransferase